MSIFDIFSKSKRLTIIPGRRYENAITEQLKTYLTEEYKNARITIVEVGDTSKNLNIEISVSRNPIGIIRRNPKTGYIDHVAIYSVPGSGIKYFQNIDINAELAHYVGAPLDNIPNPVNNPPLK